MKAFAVPTAVAGINAGLSLLFFVGISHVLGDRMLGEIILVQSSVALLQITCVPSCWIYVLGGAGEGILRKRFSEGVVAEVGGILLGAAVLALVLALPFDFVQPWRQGAFAMYISLAVQASSSCMGWLRAHGQWRRYSAWVVASNLIRVPLIWLTPLLVEHGWLAVPRDRATAIFVYFALADIVRWLFFYLPVVRRIFAFPGWPSVVAGTRRILQNWFFDVGSALTEIADKIVVGAVLGPQLLVVYFFARRLGVIATMINEPYYAEHYRRIAAMTVDRLWSSAQTRVYRRGLLLSATLFVAMATVISVGLRIPAVAQHLPPTAVRYQLVFLLILLTDCALAANRWSRFVTQLQGGVKLLLALRLALFVAFSAGVWSFGNRFDGLGLCLAFGLVWAIECSALAFWLRRSHRRTAVFP